MQIHVFIDTNVFLSFFAYTNDDIEELKKLVGLIKNKKIALYLTEQVCSEFNRNRESKILQALEEFGKISMPGLPRLMAHYPNVDKYHKAVKSLKTFHNNLIEHTKKDALAEELPADKLFSALIAYLLRSRPTKTN
jgi:predicted nucleic acid-binding protein